MRTTIKLAICAVALALSAPAAAQVTLNFASGSNSSIDGSVGNTVSVSNGGITATASAWWYNPTAGVNTPQSAYLGQYTHGLGVTDHLASVNAEDGTNNSHTIDNYGNRDFVILTFNQPVNIISADLYAFVVNGSTDNDAWVSYGTMGGSFNSTVFNDLLTRDYNRSGGSLTVGFNSTGQYGNVWLIGAANPAAGSVDYSSDGFKLSSIQVRALPEPATWAMMLLGFGAIGLTARRRRAAGPALA